MKNLLLLAIILLTGCASANMVPFEIDSTPRGIQIDVNGVSFGTTPTTVELQCSKRWVGLLYAPGGWAYDKAEYQITALPSKVNPGLSQTKMVNACQIKSPPGKVFFDIGLETVAPRQRIDLNINQNNSKSSIEEAIGALKLLRDQGLLTEKEYQEKVLSTVNSSH